MVHACVAVGCRNRKNPDVKFSFYTFPKDAKRREQWIAAIKRANWQPTATSRLCAVHFVSGEKSNDPLSPDYVPSIFHHVSTTGKKKLQRNYNRYMRHRDRLRAQRREQNEAAATLLHLAVGRKPPRAKHNRRTLAELKDQKIDESNISSNSNQGNTGASCENLMQTPVKPGMAEDPMGADNINDNTELKVITASCKPLNEPQINGVNVNNKIESLLYCKPATPGPILISVTQDNHNEIKKCLNNPSHNPPDLNITTTSSGKLFKIPVNSIIDLKGAMSTPTAAHIILKPETAGDLIAQKRQGNNKAKSNKRLKICPVSSMVHTDKMVDYELECQALRQENEELRKMVDSLSPDFAMECQALRLENFELRKKIDSLSLSEAAFETDSEKVKFHTGLPNFNTFKAVLSLISDQTKKESKGKLSPFQQLLMTLMKLRFNFPHQYLAYRFGVTIATVSKITNHVISLLYVTLLSKAATIPTASPAKDEQSVGNLGQIFTIIYSLTKSPHLKMTSGDKIIEVCIALNNFASEHTKKL